MYHASSEQHRKIVSAVVKAASSLPKPIRGMDARRFLQTYYANVDATDLAARSPVELATSALSHLKFAQRRRGRALVRVFNPTLREHGFSSAHTVIEMVNDDMPFLVDTIGLALTRRELTLHFLAHPVFAVSRSPGGALLGVHDRGDAAEGRKQRLESFQHVEVDRIVDPATLASLASEIERSMRDVRAACGDWAKMQHAVRRTADDLESLGARLDPRDLSETRALLEWMEDRHFTFLGYREYRLRGGKGRENLQRVEATGLGILRRGNQLPGNTTRILASDIRRRSRSHELTLITKANSQSTVHRAGYLDYVGINHFDAKGRLIGERRFLGLWTTAAYGTSPARDSGGAPQGGPGAGALCAGPR